MLNQRIYMADSGLVSIGATSATPALFLSTGATTTLVVAKIKFSVEAVSSPAPPSNGSILGQLSVVTGTKAGGAAVTPTQLSGNPLAAQSTWSSGSTALTGLTQTTELHPMTIPYTSGASWDDDHENTGLEIPLGISGQWAFYFTAASGAGSGCSVRFAVWFAE